MRIEPELLGVQRAQRPHEEAGRNDEHQGERNLHHGEPLPEPAPVMGPVRALPAEDRWRADSPGPSSR